MVNPGVRQTLTTSLGSMRRVEVFTLIRRAFISTFYHSFDVGVTHGLVRLVEGRPASVTIIPRGMVAGAGSTRVRLPHRMPAPCGHRVGIGETRSPAINVPIV